MIAFISSIEAVRGDQDHVLPFREKVEGEDAFHASIRVTEKHYKPWVKTLQDKLEADAMKGWPTAEPVAVARRKKSKRAPSKRA